MEKASTMLMPRPANASVSVIDACPINSENEPTNALTTVTGEGSMYDCTRPVELTRCQSRTSPINSAAG